MSKSLKQNKIMTINIRPACDLKYKLAEIENFVMNTNHPVFLTKAGYGAMVILSLDAFSALFEEKEESSKQIKEDLEEETIEIDSLDDFIESSFKNLK